MTFFAMKSLFFIFPLVSSETKMRFPMWPAYSDAKRFRYLYRHRTGAVLPSFETALHLSDQFIACLAVDEAQVRRINEVCAQIMNDPLQRQVPVDLGQHGAVH